MDKFVMDIRLEQWIPILEAQARSGLDKQTFCKQHGISRGLFFKWQRILRERIAEGFDPSTVSLPAVADKRNDDVKDNEPVFYEITPTNSCSLADTNKTRQYPAPADTVPAPDNSSGVNITYGDFSINLSGAIDEVSLMSILKAVKNA